jgi:hypothetical protein
MSFSLLQHAAKFAVNLSLRSCVAYIAFSLLPWRYKDSACMVLGTWNYHKSHEIIQALSETEFCNSQCRYLI